MKNTILLLVVAFSLQFNTLSFGQQNYNLNHHNQVDLFSSEIFNFVQMILDGPDLFFTEENMGFDNEDFLKKLSVLNIEIIIEMELVTNEISPILMREPSIIYLPNTVDWIKLDTENWQPNYTVISRPVTNLGGWEFKVGAGEGGYY